MLGQPARRSGSPIKLCRLPSRRGSPASSLKATQHRNTYSHGPGQGTADRRHISNIYSTYFQHIPTHFKHISNIFYANLIPEKNENMLKNRIDIFGRRNFYTYFQHMFDIFQQILNMFLHIFVFFKCDENMSEHGFNIFSECASRGRLALVIETPTRNRLVDLTRQDRAFLVCFQPARDLHGLLCRVPAARGVRRTVTSPAALPINHPST